MKALGIAAAKQEARRLILERRRATGDAWVRERSLRVQAAALGMRVFEEAAAVGCYIGVGREVGTEDILARCRRDGKTVCVPAHDPRSGEYRMARLDVGAHWRLGWGRIPEPERPVWTSVGELDVMLVPGLAFDVNGRRLGHGCGHYDKMMGAYAGRKPFKLGLAFEFQILAELPADERDVDVDAVITEDRVIAVSSGMDLRGGV